VQLKNACARGPWDFGEVVGVGRPDLRTKREESFSGHWGTAKRSTRDCTGRYHEKQAPQMAPQS